MRNLLRAILRVLDGSPHARLGGQRGQSLIELAFMTPIFLIMFVGIVEIGWYANHVLILLEVTRVGARQATVLTGEFAPLQWDNSATIHPIAYLLDRNSGYTFTVDGALHTFPGINVPEGDYAPEPGSGGTTPSFSAVQTSVPTATVSYRNWDPISKRCIGDIGFYNFIACSMMRSMEPLTLGGRFPYGSQVVPVKKLRQLRTSVTDNQLYPDDIVVSLFSLQVINNRDPNETPNTEFVDWWQDNEDLYPITYDFDTDLRTQGRYRKGFQSIVVGRYPTNANECNVFFLPDSIYVVGAGANALLPNESILSRVIKPIFEFYEASPPTLAGRISGTRAKPVPTGTWTTDQVTVNDPFDYIPDTNGYSVAAGDEGTLENDSRNFVVIGGSNKWIELQGIDRGPEFQRGFSWTGQHVVFEQLADGRQIACIGSEWTNQEIEYLMNTPRFLRGEGTPLPVPMPPRDVNNVDQITGWDVTQKRQWNEFQQRASNLPNQGLVLVEMFWTHDTMLDLPVFDPVMTMFGAQRPIVISVWAAFPVPSVEPNVIYRAMPQ